MTMTMKLSLFDINHLNTMIGENKAEKILCLMNRRPKNIAQITYKLSTFYIDLHIT